MKPNNKKGRGGMRDYFSGEIKVHFIGGWKKGLGGREDGDGEVNRAGGSSMWRIGEIELKSVAGRVRGWEASLGATLAETPSRRGHGT